MILSLITQCVLINYKICINFTVTAYTCIWKGLIIQCTLQIGIYTAEQLTSSKILIHLIFTHGPTHILNTIKVTTLMIEYCIILYPNIQNLKARIIIAWIPHTEATAFWCMVWSNIKLLEAIMYSHYCHYIIHNFNQVTMAT